MTIRTLRILFWSLMAVVLVLCIVLFTARQHSRDRVAALADEVPVDTPYTTPESVTLALADDSTGHIIPTARDLALPTEINARTKALLNALFADYARPGSQHPLPPGEAVGEVFLVRLPVIGYDIDPTQSQTNPDAATAVKQVLAEGTNWPMPQTPGGLLAIIDLHSNYVAQHPSGVGVELSTVRSVLETLHIGVPQIEQVRFLVDGQPRDTLAGHIDISRTYPVDSNSPQNGAAAHGR